MIRINAARGGHSFPCREKRVSDFRLSESRRARPTARAHCKVWDTNLCTLEQQGRNGAPGGTRTPDLLLRRQTLYPAELRAPCDARKLVYRTSLRAVYALQTPVVGQFEFWFRDTSGQKFKLTHYPPRNTAAIHFANAALPLLPSQPSRPEPISRSLRTAPPPAAASAHTHPFPLLCSAPCRRPSRAPSMQ